MIFLQGISPNSNEWNLTDNAFIPSNYNSPPEPVDLEAIELLLNDRNGKYTDDFLEEANDDGQESEVFYVDDHFYAEPLNTHQSLVTNVSECGNYKFVASPPIVNKTIRPTPYQIIRPNRASSASSVKSIPIVPATTNQIGLNNVTTTISQPKYVLCNPSQQQSVSTPKTIFVPVQAVNVTSNQRESTNHMNTICNSDYVKKSEERKRRNRESAQISRERKKHEFEQMKTRISELERENMILKQRVSNCRCSAQHMYGGGKASNMNGAKAVGITLLALCAVVTFAPFK